MVGESFEKEKGEGISSFAPWHTVHDLENVNNEGVSHLQQGEHSPAVEPKGCDGRLDSLPQL